VGIYEDVVGYFVGSETICPGCLEDEEKEQMAQVDEIPKGATEGRDYYCDRCNKEL